jgi:hypothetical protein
LLSSKGLRNYAKKNAQRRIKRTLHLTAAAIHLIPQRVRKSTIATRTITRTSLTTRKMDITLYTLGKCGCQKANLFISR